MRGWQVKGVWQPGRHRTVVVYWWQCVGSRSTGMAKIKHKIVTVSHIVVSCQTWQTNHTLWLQLRNNEDVCT